MSMRRYTVARGVYRDPYGFTVRWRERGTVHEKRFPLDTPLEHLKAYRKRQQLQAGTRAPATGSFTREAVRFLQRRRAQPSFKSDRAHLRPWIRRFGRASRFAVTRDGVQGAIDGWRAEGYSPRELRHRLRILQTFYRTLDPGAPTPADGVKLPPILKRKPRPVDARIVRDVALNLRKQEIEGIGRLRTAKTRARFLILALTGVRPAQLMRARPADLDWTRGLWYVDPAKHDEGTVVAFNEQIRAAWELFAAADAWGPYDGRSFSRTLQRNGWPKGVRPYQLRHTVGQTLKELGADLGAIQGHLGHASPATTAAFYLGPSLAQLRATSAQLDGRVDPFALDLSRAPFTTAAERKAKDLEKTPQSARRPKTPKTGSDR